MASVSILTPYEPTLRRPFSLTRKDYQSLGISADCIFWPGGSESRASYGVHRWLTKQKFDHIIFVDSGALGYWPLNARTQGVSYANTGMSLLAIEPSEISWHEQQRYWADPADLQLVFMERRCASLADGLVAVNEQVGAYYTDHQADRPLRSLEFLSALDGTVIPYLASPSRGQGTIAFAGAQAAQNGLRLFCAAAEVMGSRLMRRGKSGMAPRLLFDPTSSRLPNGEDTTAYLLAQTVAWPGEVVIAPRGGPGAMLAEARACDAVVVAGSTLGAATPMFLAAAEAGLRTVSLAASTATAQSLADAIEVALARPSGSPKPWPTDRDQYLRDMLTFESSVAPEPDVGAPLPLVSVCISFFNRPGLLEQALQSLRDQTYPHVEVVVVDDASPSDVSRNYTEGLKEEFERRGWRLIRNDTELWQSVSRNKAVDNARGDYVLIMDDDNIAHPLEIETMVKVARRTGAEVVWCFQDLFEGMAPPKLDLEKARVEYFPVGPFAAIGPIWNTSGDVNALFKKTTFQALGGYSARVGIGCEDYEIGVKVALNSIPWAVIPDALYGYRFSDEQMAKKLSNLSLYLSHRRIVEPYVRAMPSSWADLPRLANDLFYADWQKNGGAYWARLIPPANSVAEASRRTNPVNDEFLFHLAQNLTEFGASELALEYLRGLSHRWPNDERILRCYLDCLIAAGALIEAQSVLRKTAKFEAVITEYTKKLEELTQSVAFQFFEPA